MYYQQGLSYCQGSWAAAAKRTNTKTQLLTRPNWHKIGAWTKECLFPSYTHMHTNSPKEKNHNPPTNVTIKLTNVTHRAHNRVRTRQIRKYWDTELLVKISQIKDRHKEKHVAVRPKDWNHIAIYTRITQEKTHSVLLLTVEQIFLTCSHWLHHIEAWGPYRSHWHQSWLEGPGGDTKVKSPSSIIGMWVRLSKPVKQSTLGSHTEMSQIKSHHC